MGAEVPPTDEQPASAEQVASVPQQPNNDAVSEQVAPTPQPPSIEAEPSFRSPVPDRLIEMLSPLGNSFRDVQNIPDFDPEAMIGWMNSFLTSMNMVC